MSQIRKALEKAKAQRLQHQSGHGSPREQREPVEAASPSACYTPPGIAEISREELLRRRIVAVDEENPASEWFKLLRTRIFQQTRPRKWNVIQVTGFDRGEGKSTVAANLAISIARDSRQDTLLVDLDFREPSVHRLLGLAPEVAGLVSHFIEDVPLEALFINPGIRGMTVLPAGGCVNHATELLGSQKMEVLLKELKSRDDDRYVILDTPGINLCPDPLVIAEYADAILLVARVNRTSRESVKNCVERLPREKLLGVVLNDVAPDQLVA
jgi:protein-tyrosine kinase